VIDTAAIVALDVHVHTERTRSGHDPMPPSLRAAAASYFHSDQPLPTVDDVATYYRERSLAAVVFTVDWESHSGIPPIPNEEIAEAAATNADVLIPFASVDPARPDAVQRVRRLVAEHSVRGFKFHPNLQQFFPNERSVYPLYEAIAEAGVPALFHSGHSGIGTGVPGGGGLRLKYSNPMCLDDVAADFPELQIVLAHPSFPWQDEAISICLHKSNVWIDLSGWSPKYFPPQLVQYANTQLREKVLFGSDFPLLTPDRWLADFEAAPFRDEVRPLVLKENAVRLLGLTPAAPPP
jgi:predicted TIM-barrel fold metal-dependent hydrolase